MRFAGHSAAPQDRLECRHGTIPSTVSARPLRPVQMDRPLVKESLRSHWQAEHSPLMLPLASQTRRHHAAMYHLFHAIAGRNCLLTAMLKTAPVERAMGAKKPQPKSAGQARHDHLGWVRPFCNPSRHHGCSDDYRGTDPACFFPTHRKSQKPIVNAIRCRFVSWCLHAGACVLLPNPNARFIQPSHSTIIRALLDPVLRPMVDAGRFDPAGMGDRANTGKESPPDVRK